MTTLVFFTIGKWNYPNVAIAWLVGASLFFYGWWNPVYVPLIILSILFNFVTGEILRNPKEKSKHFRVLIFGVAVNLLWLIYFKYSNFFVNNFNQAFGTNIHFERIILPLAISFFTFQQITYLVDSYKGETKNSNFLRYCLFVTFFPQLIAGPIVHHKEIIPQYIKNKFVLPNQESIATGITLFVIGLFKKVVISDTISKYATPVFQVAEMGDPLTFGEAWIGALAYSFQLYFDFSGYSDMAVGLGKMFGVSLPQNFNSPYKSKNIIEFWQRWHISLSRFFKDYVYIPLGGNRGSKKRRYINVMITMTLGGLWHGAGWTFLIWGALHGLYLQINYSWRYLRQALGFPFNRTSRLSMGAAQIVTFVAVIISWVIFRSETIGGAVHILYSMSGANGFSWTGALENNIFPYPIIGASLIIILLLVVWFTPNSTQYVFSAKEYTLKWQPTLRHALLTAVVFCICFFHIDSHSEFLYFQF